MSRQTIHVNGLIIEVVYNVENNNLSVSVVSDPNSQERSIQLASVELFNVAPSNSQIADNNNTNNNNNNNNTNQQTTNPDLTSDTITIRNQGELVTGRLPPRRPISSNTTDNDIVGPDRRVRPRLSGASTSSNGPMINYSTTSGQIFPFVLSAHNSAPVPPRRNMVQAGLTDEQIRSCLTPTKYSQSYFTDSDLERCCICQENYIVEEDLTSLRCQHMFHQECIEFWLKQNIICPVCRRNAFQE